MQTRNKCYTYFKIVGNFKTDEISQMLGLTPDEKWDIGDFRRNGTKYDFANWKMSEKIYYTFGGVELSEL